MENMIVRKLDNDDKIPYELLLLADPSVEAINEYIHKGNCYAAYINNYIIGVYVLLETKPSTIELMNIAVDEAYHGRGMGKKLIYSAIDMARKQGARVLEVGTGNSSISQLAFYQKCGFRIVGVDRDFFRRNYEEKIIENGIECVDMIRLSMVF